MGWNSPHSNQHLLSTFLYQTVSRLIFRLEEAREMNAPVLRDKECAQSLSVHPGVGLGFDSKSAWLQSWYSWLSLWKHARFHACCLYVYPAFRKDYFFGDKDYFFVKVCLSAGYSNLDAGWSSKYYIQSVLPSLLQWNKQRLSYGAVYPDPHLGLARRPGTPVATQQELMEGDFFCPTAAEPGAAEGNDEEGWAGNQQQGDRDDEEAGGPCAAPAGPGGAGQAEVPARRGEDRPQVVVSLALALSPWVRA